MTEDTLQMLSVLCAAYADSITASENVRPLIAAYPACPAYFAEEMLKLARLHRDFNLQSHIVVLDMGEHAQRLDLFHLLLRQRRRTEPRPRRRYGRHIDTLPAELRRHTHALRPGSTCSAVRLHWTCCACYRTKGALRAEEPSRLSAEPGRRLTSLHNTA
jgi:hypothetical protein